MEKKIVSRYIDTGLGFPVVLENVPMVKVRGAWTPHVNYTGLAREVLGQLVELNGRLSGKQIKFIRLHFELTLQQFAKRFGITHPAVLKWEAKANRPTGMNWSTEKDIRLFVAKELQGTAKDFLARYMHLETIVALRAAKITVDAEKLAA